MLHRDEQGKPSIITPGTLVPVGLVLMGLSLIVAAVWWAAALDTKVEYAADQLAEARQDIRLIKDDFAALKLQLGKDISLR